ncbi:hypothetical protein [Methylobacter sp.]|uniref:hypothetical protein n=1 Tax=Methylobacter sp. TaxID=2051955 RepID=UPI002FDC9910
MSKKPITPPKDIDQQQHIRDLQRRAEEFVGGELSFFESEEMATELQERFWERGIARNGPAGRVLRPANTDLPRIATIGYNSPP